jgi:hypothetical protein
MRSGTKWQFRTKRFRVVLTLERDHGYQYDGDDEDGETQAKLDSGEFVAFDSRVVVELDGEEIAADSLGGSVYEDGRESEFWTAHRDADPMNRNSSIMRAARGHNCVICHYFPDMVRTAIAEAREHIRSQASLPYVRESANG